MSAGVLASIATPDAGSAAVSGRSLSATGDAAALQGTAASASASVLELDSLGGGDLLRGRNSGIEVVSIDGEGAVAAASFAGDGSALTSVDAATLDGNAASSFSLDGHDHFNETWTGNPSGSSALLVESTGGSSSALHGRSTNTAGNGVLGENTNPTLVGYGVRGIATGTGGQGVRGEATATSGSPKAVVGDVQSASGYSAYFTGIAGSRNYFQRDTGIGVSTPQTRLHVQETVSGGAVDTHVALIENLSTGTDADGLAIKAGPTANPGAGNNFITLYDGDSTLFAQLQGDGAGSLEIDGLSSLPDDLGIGVKPPAAKLHVRDANSAGEVARFENTAADGTGLLVDVAGSTDLVTFTQSATTVGSISTFDLLGPRLRIDGHLNLPGPVVWVGLPALGGSLLTVAGEDINGTVTTVYNTSSDTRADGIEVVLTNTTNNNSFIAFRKQSETTPAGEIRGNGGNGVELVSYGADYAEYLPRLDPSETLQPGDVVGLHGSHVSLTTAMADRVMAVTTGSIVLGNAPPRGEENQHIPVAFVGQVDLRVLGPVSAGDVIVPSGREDGTASAIALEELSLDRLPSVIGRSLARADGLGTNVVRVLVGLPDFDLLAQVVKRQQAEVSDLRRELAAQRAAIDQLLGRSRATDTTSSDR